MGVAFGLPGTIRAMRPYRVARRAVSATHALILSALATNEANSCGRFCVGSGPGRSGSAMADVDGPVAAHADGTGYVAQAAPGDLSRGRRSPADARAPDAAGGDTSMLAAGALHVQTDTCAFACVCLCACVCVCEC